MAHHVFHRGALSGSVLDRIRDTYAPLILLGLDETSGTTAIDSSGSGLDFEWTGTGSPDQEAGASVVAADALESWQANTVAGNVGRLERDAFTSTDTNFSVICVASLSGSSSTRLVYDHRGGSIFFFGSVSNHMAVNEGGTKTTARDIESGYDAVMGVSMGSEIAFYENGLRFATITRTAAAALPTGGTDRVGVFATPGTGGAAWVGKQNLVHVNDTAMSDADHYAHAQLIGAVPSAGHYYKEVIEAGGMAASCVFHAPLCENAGSQSLSVDGNENHGAFIGGPTLMQTPEQPMAVYGVLCAAGQYIQAPNSGIGDLLANPFTLSFFANEANSTPAGLFGTSDAANRFDVTTLADGTIRFEAFDGVNINRIDSAPGASVPGTQVHVAITHDGAGLVELFVDGTSVGTKDISTHTKSYSGEFRFGDRLANPQIVTIELPTIFNAALPDDYIAALANGTVATSWDSAMSTLSAESGTVLWLSTQDGALKDYAAADVDTWTSTPTVAEKDFQPQITARGWSTHAETSHLQLTTGDMTIRTQFKLTGTPASPDTICAFTETFAGGGVEDEDGNTQWQLYFPSTSTIAWFHENGGGDNESATFDLPSAVSSGDEITLSARRVDNGDATVTIEMWCAVNDGTFAQMTLNSVGTGGTDNGDDTATLPAPSGGDDAWLSVLGAGDITSQNLAADMRFLQVIDADVLDDTAEQAAVTTIREALDGLLVRQF